MKKFGYFLVGISILPFAFFLQLITYLPTMGYTFALQFLSGILFRTGMPSSYYGIVTSDLFTDLYSCLYAALVIALLLPFYLFLKRRHPKPYLSMRNNLLILTGSIFDAYGLQLLSGVLLFAMEILIPKAIEDYSALIEEAGFTNPTFLILIYGILLGPIAEELLFRGVSYHFFKKSVGPTLAMIFQAVLFGIYHANLVQGIYTFFVGAFLGYVLKKHDSIVFCVCIHICFNFIGFLVGYSLPLIFSFLGTFILLLGGERFFERTNLFPYGHR